MTITVDGGESIEISGIKLGSNEFSVKKQKTSTGYMYIVRVSDYKTKEENSFYFSKLHRLFKKFPRLEPLVEF